MNRVKKGLDNQAIGLLPLLLFMFLDNYFSYLLSFIIGVTFCFVCIILFQVFSKDKVNLVTGAITQPFAEMVWVTTGGDMETVNRLTDVLVTMNTPADRGKLFKIIKMLYGLMGLPFSEEAEPMDADPAVLEYFIFSFTADFGEVIQDLIAEEAE